jgi:kynurenine formamidase
MTEDEIRDLPSNRGRWGTDDELGTLNLITDQVRGRAVAEARTGRTVSLARQVRATPLLAGGVPAIPGSPAVYQAMMFTGSPSIAMAEVLVMTPHRPELTHIDALTHVVYDGQVYPGVPLSERANPAGASRGSTAIFADGIVTRGVLLDLALGGQLAVDHPVTGADLDAAAERVGVKVQPGDAIVVRGGWNLADLPDDKVPGMTVDAIRWMHRHDVSLYLGDICDARPHHIPALGSALHRVGIGYMGMPLVDSADPTELVAVCRETGRGSFMLVVAPQRLDGATGLAVNRWRSSDAPFPAPLTDATRIPSRHEATV